MEERGAPSKRLGFWNIAVDLPERPALLFPEGERWSFGELRRRANRLAHGFRDLGLRTGDGVAALLPNDANYYALQLAALQVGLYFTPINTHLTGPEIAYIVADSEAKLFAVHADYAAEGLSAVDSAGLDRVRCFSVGAAEGFRPLEELFEGQPDTAPEGRRQGQVMLYTSGTTGRPKGVRRALPDLDPDTAAERSTLFSRAFQLRPFEGVHLVVGPLYHAGPSVYSWGSLHVGHLQVVTARFDAEQVLALIDRYRVTNTHLVATMFHRLLALPERTKRRFDLSSLRMVVHSAAPTPVEMKRRMMEWWGPVIWETYGGSEGAATIAKPQRWLEKPGTVGRAVRGVEIRVLDDEGKVCPPGTSGTIYLDIDGAPFEYWKDAEKTSGVHRGRSFTLGDVGYLDEHGYLFLAGRQSDVIISGGVNIYPAEVEAQLVAHPKVADAAVIGIPDPEWGEQVRAVVQPREGVEGNGELSAELLAYCRERLAHYKCPRKIDFRPTLPREENGKLYKRKIRSEYWKGVGRSI